MPWLPQGLVPVSLCLGLLAGAFSTVCLTRLAACAPQIKQAKEDMQNNYIPILTANNVPFEGEVPRALGLSLLVLTHAPDSQPGPSSHLPVAILVTPSKTKAIGETLTNYATRVNATALALGKSDRSKVQELFLGSVFKVRASGWSFAWRGKRAGR